MISLYINLIWPLVFSIIPAHDYHVGIYEIEYKNNRFQVSQKLFVDDFEKALKKIDDEIVFGDELTEAMLAQAMKEYLNIHFRITIDRELLQLSYVGAEWEDEHAIYVYWESSEVPSDFRSMNIFNNIFLEVSPEQQNMHHIKINDQQKTLLLKKGKTEGSILF